MTNATEQIAYAYHVYRELTEFIRLATTLQANLTNRSQAQHLQSSDANSLARCEHNLTLLVKAQSILAKEYTPLPKTGMAGNPDRPIKALLDSLLSAGRWHGTFWQVIKARIHALLTEPKVMMPDSSRPAHDVNTHTGDPASRAPPVSGPSTAVQTETTRVFMHLYQATGKSLAAWLPQLHNLQQLAQSRPIYSDREDVLAVLEARGQVSTDAYVAINLPADVLIEAFRGSIQTDKYGHTLATLDMDHWPSQPDIDHFYHQQHTYHLIDNELLRVD